MTAVLPADLAAARIARFARRFGEPHRRLAWFAALPLILTPELVNYLRVHFLSDCGGAPWISEADLLLSDLCRPIGYEQFALDQDVRAVLIAELAAAPDGAARMREAARLLLRYCRHLGRGGAGLSPAELQAEQWSAMAYLEEQRGTAAREITVALGQAWTAAAPGAGVGGCPAAELARLVRLTEALRENLAAHPQLLDYAAEVARLLRDPAALAQRLTAAGTPGALRLVENVLVPDLSGAGPPAPPDSTESPALVEEPPTPFRDPITGSTEPGPAMVWLPGGTFRMGSPEGVGEDRERPAHPVRLSHYAVGRYPVTVGEFRRFVESSGYHTEAETGEGAYVWDKTEWVKRKDASWRNPYFKQTDEHPVVCISWKDAQAYCNWLGEATGQRYGLLTEAQWEHACRAGSEGLYCFGDDAGQLGDYAWYGGQASDGTRPVGGKRANAWGLHDLHGNCWEWCADWYADYDKANPVGSAVRVGSAARTGDLEDPEVNAAAGPHSGPYAVTDTAQHPPSENPSGSATGSNRVIRGGAWHHTADYCRAAYRSRSAPSYRHSNLGFRLSRTGPLSSYPFTLGAAPPAPIIEPPAPRRFAPYEVFRDHLNSTAPVGAAAAGDAPAMVYLPGGVFQMGDAQGDTNEQPVHPVELPAFALGRTPVTWGEYRRFCEATGTHWPEWLETGNEYHVETGKNDFYTKRGISREALDLPVVGVSWEDACAYCDWLSVQTGKRYALPTEAQWEYACRAGTVTRWCCGDDPACLSEYAWFSDNAEGRLHPAGQRHANNWGLYDMHGNCWEWCVDWYAADYYQQLATALAASTAAAQRSGNKSEQPPSGWRRIASALGIGRNHATLSAGIAQPLASRAPSGPDAGSYRVIRGGAWFNTADYCRAAYRHGSAPSFRGRNLGFRLSRTV